MMRSFYFRVLLISSILVVISCGGGGGGGGGGGSGGGSVESSVAALSPTLFPAIQQNRFSPSLNTAPPSTINAYKTSEYNAQWGLEKIKAAEAYGLLEYNGKAIAGSGTKIAIADDGVRSTHQEINANYNATGQYNVSGSDHGTHVASVAAGVKSNNTGMHGVAFNSKIISINVFKGNGLAIGIEKAVASGAKVINMSFGYVNEDDSRPLFVDIGSSGYNNKRSELKSEMDSAVSGDIFVAIASGNESNHSRVDVPAVLAGDSYFNAQVIVVSAVDSNNNIASFSNYCSQVKDYCLVAPGVNIHGAIMTNNSSYDDYDGTSMATPHVAGAAAVLRSAWPLLSAFQTRQILLQTATDLGAPGVDDIYGHGLLNLSAAVQPQGQNIVASSASINSAAIGYDIRNSAINNSVVFGDAYINNIAPILQNAVFFDDFGRDYKANLDQKISTPTNANYNLDNLMFNNYQFTELPLASGSDNLKFKFLANNLEYDSFSGQSRIKKLGLKYLAYDKSNEDLSEINQANVSFSYSKNFESGLKFNFSNNDLSNDLEQNPINKFGFIAANYNISPYLSLSKQDFSNNSTGKLDQKQFSLSQKLGKNFTSNFSYFNSSQNYSFLKSGELKNKGLSSGLSYSLKDNLDLSFSYGNLAEYNNRFLGAKSYGAFSNQGDVTTNYLKIGLTKKLTGDLYFASSYSEGKTNINGNDSGIFRGFNNVRSRAFSLALLNNKILGGKLGMVYSEPLRVYRGSVDIDVPIGINSDGNINRLKADNISLKPDGKERDIELFYGFNIGNLSKVDFNLFIQKQPGNIRGAITKYLYMLKYNMQF